MHPDKYILHENIPYLPTNWLKDYNSSYTKELAEKDLTELTYIIPY